MADNFDTSDKTPDIAWPKREAFQDKPSVTQSDQWLRRINLLVGSENEGIQLTPEGAAGRNPLPQLRVDFQVRKATNQSPNLLTVRAYNLSPETMRKVIEYKKVSLSAGYVHGRYAEIFRGTVVQYRRGKENPVDTYLEIIAGDGDLAINFDVGSFTVPAGQTNDDVLQKLVSQLKGVNQEISIGHLDTGTEFGKQTLIRAQSVMGTIGTHLRTLANAYNADWFIDNGKVNFVMRDKYLPGEAAVLSPSTGLVGIPEVTPQGIQARCLLNPNLRVGGLVKIDTDILSGVAYQPGSKVPLTPEEAPGGQVFPVATWGAQLSQAFTSPTGTYKILLLEHSGDTRGNPWYSTIVCAAVDQSGKLVGGGSVDLPLKRSRAETGASS